MSSALISGFEPDDKFHSVGAYAVAQAYESAGIGPKDIHFAEVHDASATSEIIAYEYLQLCEPGGGGKLIETGYTALGGKVPVNALGGYARVTPLVRPVLPKSSS